VQPGQKLNWQSICTQIRHSERAAGRWAALPEAGSDACYSAAIATPLSVSSSEPAETAVISTSGR
jgi:hypothetical protein